MLVCGECRQMNACIPSNEACPHLNKDLGLNVDLDHQNNRCSTPNSVPESVGNLSDFDSSVEIIDALSDQANSTTDLMNISFDLESTIDLDTTDNSILSASSDVPEEYLVSQYDQHQTVETDYSFESFNSDVSTQTEEIFAFDADQEPT